MPQDDTQADGYYGEDHATDGEIDLSFLDDDTSDEKDIEKDTDQDKK